MVSPKSLTSTERQRVRNALRGLLETYQTQGKLARKLRVSQQTISSALSGRSGVSLARRVANELGQSFDQLVAGAPGPGAKLRDDPRWADAEQEARRKNKAIPDTAFNAAGDMASPTSPSNLDAKFVAGLAKVWAGAAEA